MISLKKYLKYGLLFAGDIFYKKKNKLKISNTMETLNELLNTEKSISRFGDGEIEIILKKDLIFQKYDEKLADLLKKILKIENENKNHIVAIPYVWKESSEYTKKSIRFWFIYLLNNRKKIYPLLNFKYSYFDSQITRIYINRKNKKKSREYFELWKKIWKNKNILIVEGQYTRFGVGNDLLEEAKSIRRILCPSKNAFNYYKQIRKEIIRNYKKEMIILILLGPTATVLAWDLSMIGLRVIDLGNLDMEYEWLKMNVETQTKIYGKYTHEALNGEEVEKIFNLNYEEQIIAKIGIEKDI